MHEQVESYTENSNVIEFSSEFFSYRGVKDITEPVQMSLIENEVDLSSIIQSMARAKGSQYRDALWQIKNRYKDLLSSVKILCKQSNQSRNCILKANNTLIELFRDISEELSSRIIYPYRYPDLDKVSYFKQAIDSLDLECPACTDLNIAFAIMKSPREQYNQLYNKIKNKDSVCQKDIINTLNNFIIFSMILPKKCQNEKDHPICKTILNDEKTLRNWFPDLTKLVYEEDISEQTEAQSICLECSQISGTGNKWA
ncbi:MAG: hypothetical protein OXM55_01435 [Bdellovibrionales bacterium]|nr:hypothetical protein [Bdellovibrionales bacterium]